MATRERPGAAARAAAFPLETRGRGYERAAVDAFLLRARAAFEEDPDAEPMTAQSVRDASFPLTRHGYVIAAVDAALGRIEDAFAARERADAVATVGARAWVAQQRALAQEVLNRLTRPRRRRFDRVGVLRHGYRIDEVDLVADKLTAYLAEGEKVTPEQVRSVAFRMQRGGYRENQVDAVLDAVLEIMLAVG
ncbi:DivIVA domain-containing protein [Microbacterium sp. SORGH_AS_0888]|uniref:DivIVA domain-containing protein n=1 Tax=Microbacterium sp. SORGH_AS_0888 TaxID=3041791 RepID=UPI0027D804F2|nr:DivIVA domain-containing protein [Microbacterium sp. SORGH_AS_0888]